jgi:hypothetical protein
LPHFYLIRLNAFLGFGVYALALAALIRIKRPEVKEMALLILFGMLLAFRPVNKIIYDLFPPLYAIRGALRFFVISSAGISLMAALTLHTVMPYLKKAWMIALLALGMLTFHFLENITFPLLRFESGDLYRPAASYLEYFKSRPQTVILNLPSNNPFGIRPVRFEKGFTERLFGYNRETIYMNHQTYHRKNIINGNNGYFPASRLVTQRLVDRIAEDSAIDSLMMMGMEYVVFHKYLVVEPEEDNLPLLLSRPEYFRPEYEDQDIVIFTVRKSGEGSF